MNHDHHFPCLHCHPQGYIRMVQHLIERCMLLRMSQDNCVKALAERASIDPLITLTVWRELVKENRGFFQAYFKNISLRPHAYACKVRRDSEEETIGDAEIELKIDKNREATSSSWGRHN